MRTVSLLTFLSRVLGLVRDIGMAAAFGNGPLMDAFSVAFRIPNLARGLFGEGALTTAFLPAFLRERTEHGAKAGWRLASGVVALLTLVLCAIVVVAELLIAALALRPALSEEYRLLLGLTAVLMPYLVLVCVASQLNAVLYGLNHFFWPAMEPVLCNVVWIACLWLVVPRLASATAGIYAVAITIVVSGFVQIAVPVPTLRRRGFRYVRDWKKSYDALSQIGQALLAVAVGLSVTQLNTLIDGLVAWGFARPASGSAIIAWLPGAIEYPLREGTASALYFGQRVYQFPLGVFGVALGTVIFPVLSRHAAQQRMDRLRQDLVRGLKLMLFISIPASAGLVILARPLAILLFKHGHFDDDAVTQTAGMIRMFGCAVWAYCGLLIVHRGFYAVGDRRAPLVISVVSMAINVGLDLTLMWPMGGPGLALATAISSAVQFGLVTWLFQQRVGRLDWRDLGRSTLQTCAATVLMSFACAVTAAMVRPAPGWDRRLLAVAVPMAVSLAVYFAIARLGKRSELGLLFHRGNGSDDRDW